MKLSGYEKETVVNFNEAEQTASIYTYNAAMQKQLADLCVERRIVIGTNSELFYHAINI